MTSMTPDGQRAEAARAGPFAHEHEAREAALRLGARPGPAGRSSRKSRTGRCSPGHARQPGWSWADFDQRFLS